MSQPPHSTPYSRFLPIANIGRIMKKHLPQSAKIAKDAKQTVQQCVSQFISFITSQACQKCKQQKRKTINGQDLLAAVKILGFDGYQDILRAYLGKYRETVRASGGEVGEVEEDGEEDDADQEKEEDRQG